MKIVWKVKMCDEISVAKQRTLINSLTYNAVLFLILITIDLDAGVLLLSAE